MEEKQVKPPFPGQQKGIIRILIKQQHEQKEDSVQLRFNLDDNEANDTTE